MKYFKTLLPNRELEMDIEDREKILKWLRNAGMLLAEEPFTFFEVFKKLYDNIVYEYEMDDELFALIAESGLTDIQILEFLYIGNDNSTDIAEQFVKSMSWSADRLWLALKNSFFEDDDIVGFMMSLEELSLIIERLMADNCSYTRIVNALTGSYTREDIISAFIKRNVNDFRIIELVQLFLFEDSNLFEELPQDWSLDRIIKALSSAGYHRSHICRILFENQDSDKEVIKAMLLVWPDPLLVAKISLFHNGDLISPLIYSLEDRSDTVNNSSEIIRQLKRDSDDIERFLEHGYLH